MKKITHSFLFEVAGWKIKMTGTSTIEDMEPKAAASAKRRPTSPEALFVASLFNRQPTTDWSDKEIKAFSDAKGHLTAGNMDLIGAYYKAQRAQNGGIHRRDLLTFLNNLPGEIDRALQAKDKPQHFNGSTRQPTPAGARVAGNANSGMSDQYAGIGRVADPGKSQP